jgi:hypothetical protein
MICNHFTSLKTRSNHYVRAATSVVTARVALQ